LGRHERYDEKTEATKRENGGDYANPQLEKYSEQPQRKGVKRAKTQTGKKGKIGKNTEEQRACGLKNGSEDTWTRQNSWEREHTGKCETGDRGVGRTAKKIEVGRETGPKDEEKESPSNLRNAPPGGEKKGIKRTGSAHMPLKSGLDK